METELDAFRSKIKLRDSKFKKKDFDIFYHRFHNNLEKILSTQLTTTKGEIIRSVEFNIENFEYQIDKIINILIDYINLAIRLNTDKKIELLLNPRQFADIIFKVLEEFIVISNGVLQINLMKLYRKPELEEITINNLNEKSLYEIKDKIKHSLFHISQFAPKFSSMSKEIFIHYLYETLNHLKRIDTKKIISAQFICESMNDLFNINEDNKIKRATFERICKKHKIDWKNEAKINGLRVSVKTTA